MSRTTLAHTKATPAGLRQAMKLVSYDGINCDGDEVYPFAAQAIEAIDEDSGVSLGDTLDRAMQALYPVNNERDRTLELARMAGFNVGFAVCWLLMREIAGGAR